MSKLSVEMAILEKSITKLELGFSNLPEIYENTDYKAIESILMDVANKLTNNYPYFHPFYLGQMLKPPHPIARLAYQLAMQINPNNHALDGGIASSEMEKEVIKDISSMFGFYDGTGHLTSSGTIANLEALWIAGKESPEKAIAASEQAHYTHRRISKVLGLPFVEIKNDENGRMDINFLTESLEKYQIGTVVVTLGNTGFGAIDPLLDILKLRELYDFRIHVDAAYGGYFILDDSLEKNIKTHFECIEYVDSLVVDPHKHGLQPYGCGCVLFSDKSISHHYRHDSPYTYFSSKELHLGEISLECSRAGASAVALYSTMKAFPLKQGGDFSHRLQKSRQAAQKLAKFVESSKNYITVWKPDLDIVVWAPRGSSASEISNISHNIFDQCAKYDIHIALFKIPTRMFLEKHQNIDDDNNFITCLRACLMKPEHLIFIDEICNRIKQATADVMESGENYAKKIIHLIVDTFNTGKWSELEALDHIKVSFQDMATTQTTTNIPQLIEYIDSLASTFPDLIVNMNCYFKSDNMEVCELLFEGHQLGSYPVADGVIPPTRLFVAWKACMVVESKNVKDIHIRLYYDIVTIFDQLALSQLLSSNAIQLKEDIPL